MCKQDDALDEIFKKTALVLRELGFRGSGQTYRKVADDFVFVINFQRSRWGPVFYVNLGAQPPFVAAEGHASLKTLKESECVWRRRVGKEWPSQFSDEQFQSFVDELVTTQQAFFGHLKTFRVALTTHTPEALLDKFVFGTTQGCGSLHLVRAALALKQPDIARNIGTAGLDPASERATKLWEEILEVLARY